MNKYKDIYSKMFDISIKCKKCNSEKIRIFNEMDYYQAYGLMSSSSFILKCDKCGNKESIMPMLGVTYDAV